jgi:hypothetical protein
MYPEPTVEAPDMATLHDMVTDSVCETTDGCEAEPDGHCEHGYPSWLLHLGFI